MKKQKLSDFSYWETRYKTYSKLDDVKSSRTAYKIVQFIKSIGLDTGSWVLDAGCGAGNITKIVRDNFRHSNVVGIDLSQKMIDAAKFREEKGLRFFCEDFFSYISEINPFFNLMIMSLVIHHFTNGLDQKALDKAHSCLKKNGNIIIAEAIPPSDQIFDYYQQIFSIKEDRNCYALADLLKMVRVAGFYDIKFQTYPFDIRLLSWLNDNTLTQAKKDLLYSMHVSASEEFKKAYCMKALSGGNYRLRCKMVLIAGRKS